MFRHPACSRSRALENQDNSEGDSENEQGQEEADIDDADGDSAAASSDDSGFPGPAGATANSLPPPPPITQDIATASQWLQLSPPLGVYPTAQGHRANQVKETQAYSTMYTCLIFKK